MRLLLLLLSFATVLAAASQPVPPPAPAPKAPPVYPLAYCIVSGEHLEAGQIVPYVYRAPGQPDRPLRFCCHKCLARFKADPEKYLRKLDEAVAKMPGKN